MNALHSSGWNEWFSTSFSSFQRVWWILPGAEKRLRVIRKNVLAWDPMICKFSCWSTWDTKKWKWCQHCHLPTVYHPIQSMVLFPQCLSTYTLCDSKAIFIKAVVWPHWCIDLTWTARAISLLKEQRCVSYWSSSDVSFAQNAAAPILHVFQSRFISGWGSFVSAFNTRSK